MQYNIINFVQTFPVVKGYFYICVQIQKLAYWTRNLLLEVAIITLLTVICMDYI